MFASCSLRFVFVFASLRVGMDAQLMRDFDDLQEAKLKYGLANPDVSENIKKILMVAARERARSCNLDDSHATSCEILSVC